MNVSIEILEFPLCVKNKILRIKNITKLNIEYIAGKNIANPIATILSAAMMLRYSLDLDKEADAIEAAVAQVLKENYRTDDIMSEGMTQCTTTQMGDLIANHLA